MSIATVQGSLQETWMPHGVVLPAQPQPDNAVKIDTPSRVESASVSEVSVVVVADKEAYNFSALVDHVISEDDARLHMKGVIVPGGNVEDQVVSLVEAQNTARAVDRVIQGPHSLEYRTSEVLPKAYQEAPDFSYILHKYEASMRHDEARRLAYNHQLLDHILSLDTNLVFLSNFKLVLEPFVIERLAQEGITVVNVHPSVLPENKGYRTEKMALDGLNPHAHGYTFHVVVPELDSGTVLFNRPVPIPRDLDEARARDQLMRDQAQFSPQILEVLASDRPRRIVSEQEAFAFEGRPEFYGSQEHEASLKTDYQHWFDSQQKKHGEEVSLLSYNEWKASDHRVDYTRMIFEDDGGNWVTLEVFLEADEIPVAENLDLPTEFVFHISLTSEHVRRALDSDRFELEHSLSSFNAENSGGTNCCVATRNPEAVERWLEREGITTYGSNVMTPHVAKKRRPSPRFSTIS